MTTRSQTVDVANASYALMLRLLAYSYTLRRPVPQKALCVDLAMGLMRAATLLAERAARLPAGPSNPGVQRRHVVHRAPRRRAAAARRQRESLLHRAPRRARRGRRQSRRERRRPRGLRLARDRDLAKRGARGFAVAPASLAAAAPCGRAPRGGNVAARRRRGGLRRRRWRAVRRLRQPPAASPAPSQRRSAYGQRRNYAAQPERLAGPPVPTVDRRRRVHRRPQPHPRLRRQEVHPRPLLRDGRAEGLPGQREGPVDQPRRHRGRPPRRDRTRVPSGAIRYQRKDGKHDEAAPR